MWFFHANLSIGQLTIVSALSIPIGENGSIHLLTLTLTTITSMQLQNKQASADHFTSTPPNYCMQDVLVSIPICDIKNLKEWHWPPNIKEIGVLISPPPKKKRLKEVPPIFFHQRESESCTDRSLSYFILNCGIIQTHCNCTALCILWGALYQRSQHVQLGFRLRVVADAAEFHLDSAPRCPNSLSNINSPRPPSTYPPPRVSEHTVSHTDNLESSQDD